jgi:exosome complex component RRP46
MGGPIASLHPLDRADGSASYKCPSTGSNILGSVNAPVELPGRRDALKPEEATVEVFVKPGTAPGGVGERYVEGIIRNALGRLILGREKGYPRRGVVVTLAIVGGEFVGRGGSVSQQTICNAGIIAKL